MICLLPLQWRCLVSNARDEAVERVLRKFLFDLNLPQKKKSSMLARLMQALTDGSSDARVITREGARQLAENMVDTHITKGGKPEDLLPE